MSGGEIRSSVAGTLGAFLEDARRGTLLDGWLYLPRAESLRLDTPCLLVTDPDPPRDDRYIPLVAAEQGFDVEGLDSQSIEGVVAWARCFRDPPDAALLLEGFVYYCQYDAFPESPGAGPPPPWDEIQRRLDREFYDALGAERPHTSCRHDGCANGAVEHSVMCRAHHFEMINGRPCPFDD